MERRLNFLANKKAKCNWEACCRGHSHSKPQNCRSQTVLCIGIPRYSKSELWTVQAQSTGTHSSAQAWRRPRSKISRVFGSTHGLQCPAMAKIGACDLRLGTKECIFCTPHPAPREIKWSDMKWISGLRSPGSEFRCKISPPDCCMHVWATLATST